MRASQPCELCGCTEVNLHDGFYFCSECGTQDQNIQETLVEYIEVGGEVLHGQKKKVVKVVEKEKEMTDSWYRWHGFNFLLKGTADELLEFGAEPSFKTKLLWVWTLYIKKYLKKEDMGLNENPYAPDPSQKEEIDSDEDVPLQDILTTHEAIRNRAVKSFTTTLLVALIYVALNLDKSIITLTHLAKLFKDNVLSVPNKIENVIPKELKPEKLRNNIKRSMVHFRADKIRIISMVLFKQLDLGNPIVPDLRLIVDNTLKELCLPTDLKPLVFSLMEYKPCSFLDVNAKDKVIYKVPAYEFHIMTYIIWALKLCLGLDCEYEVSLSDAAEAINEKEKHPKSFIFNGESDPTDRLFSFREWVTFFQFRMIMLRHYNYRFAHKCTFDTDDYIALEHHLDILDGEFHKDLKEEMAHDILNRMKGGEVNSDVIPRSAFKPTVTPYHSYTQVIAEHLKDPEVKLRLSEDFTRYSLKYAIEDFNLVNPNAHENTNLVKGVSESNKDVTNKFLIIKEVGIYSKKMVYVKNCDNHNWLTTKPPTVDHIVDVDKINISDYELDETTNDTHNDTKNDNQNDPNDTMNLLNDSEIFNNSLMEENRALDRKDQTLHSVSESVLTNSSIASRIRFEDEIEDSVLVQIDSRDQSKTSKISITSNSRFPDIISERSFTSSSLSNSTVINNNTKLTDENIPANEEDRTILNGSIASNTFFPDTISDNSFTNSTFSNTIQFIDDKDWVTKLDETEKDTLNQFNEGVKDLNYIMEEPDGVIIFDDDFKSEVKDEPEEYDNVAMDYENTLNTSNFQDTYTDQYISLNNQSIDRDDNDSVASSIDSVNFNEATFDKAKAIKSIILYMCKKHKLPVPSEYNPRVKTKVMGTFTAQRRKPDIGRKRNQTNEKMMRGAWQAFVNDYNTVLHQDALNQLAQSVSNAIQNTEASALLDPNMTQNDTHFNNNDNMDVDNASNHSESAQVSNHSQSETTRDSADKLFSDESDGETYAKELLPEKNPNYDEDIYDPDQLFIKAAKPVDDGEIELHPDLSTIIEKKIKKDANDALLFDYTEERKKPGRDDSDDEMPLSVLKELKVLRKKLRKQNNTPLEPLLKQEVQNYKYWFRFYEQSKYTLRGRQFNQFEKALHSDFSKSFAFVLRSCAHILSVPSAELYRNLEYFEMTSIEKCRIKIKKNRSSKFKSQMQY